MRPVMRLSEFLVAYLRCTGVRHIFGLPGDKRVSVSFHHYTDVRLHELVRDLAEASADPRFAIVEAITPPDDLSPITRRYMGASGT